MASLVIDTGVETHPQISIDSMDFAKGHIGFHWIGSQYAGDCSEEFTLTLADHGELTVNQVVDAITAQMIGTLPVPE